MFFRQDELLKQLQQAKTPVAIFLKSGIKLQGIIHHFDSLVIILRDQGVQLIYKHSILTIVPQI